MAEGNKRFSLYELLKNIRNPLKQRCAWDYIIKKDDIPGGPKMKIGELQEELKCRGCSGYQIPWLTKCPGFYPYKDYFIKKK